MVKGWTTYILGKNGYLLRNSINPLAFPNISFTEYSMPAFDDGKFPYCTKGKDMHSNRIIIEDNVLLFNKLNVRKKRVWRVSNSGDNPVCSGEFLPYKSKCIDLDLLRQVLLSDYVTKYFEEHSTGSSNSQKRITPSTFLDYSIQLPISMVEQRKIVEPLLNIDELISNQEKLIEKKKAIKQGVMQELLTGKKRLEGFCDEWQEYQVGNIGDFYSGLSGKSKSDFDGGNSNYITFLNVLENSIINIRELQKVQINNGESQNKVEYGDLFFNTSSETPEEVGMCSALLDEIDNTYLNSFCFGYRLKTDKISPLFLSYYFNSEMGRKIMINLAQGATRYNLSKNNFSEVKIFLPCRNEQDAISNILFDMEQEITEQEQKLEKYKQLKQAMMEQLLTGKIRLV